MKRYGFYDAGLLGKKSTIIAGMVLWFLMVATGLGALYNYDIKAGDVEPAPQKWPESIPLIRHDKLYQLVMIVHPHCPCTRASIGELEILMAKTKGKLRATALIFVPSKKDAEWARSDLLHQLERIPGVDTYIDEDSRMTAVFGGTTSGQAFLYDPEGRLVFSGGITASRGHAGGNYGRTAIVDAVYGREVTRRSTPVFGCIVRERKQS